MDKFQIVDELNKSMEAFNHEINETFKDGSGVPATQNDIVQLARLVLDVFSDYKKVIEKLL